jgi:IS605 OrfB family transposase
LKSFEENRKEDSVLRLKRVSIRFDKRCYEFSKTTNVLTPYWLTLSLNRREKASLPIVFRERQRIEEALRGEWQITTVEMVKRDGEWYAHFVLERAVEAPDKPETIIAIDRGEHNLAVAVAISKSNPDKPMKGQFWRGEEIKRIRGLYGHIRRRLLKKKKLLKKVKELKGRERRKVNQQLHIIVNQIVAYAKQFPKPVIVMENLKGIRDNFKKSKKLNKRIHSLPFRKLQTVIEYKALLEGIEVRYLTREKRNTSRTCHRCGHVAQVEEEYLNARSAGWSTIGT